MSQRTSLTCLKMCQHLSLPLQKDDLSKVSVSFAVVVPHAGVVPIPEVVAVAGAPLPVVPIAVDSLAAVLPAGAAALSVS